MLAGDSLNLMTASQLTTFGSFTFTVDGHSTRRPATRKARALLTYLAMNRGVDAARDRLAEIFWPDVEPQRARDSLSTALHSIRRCIHSGGADADAILITTKSVLAWATETEVDALVFAKLVARGDDASDQEAMQLYRGDFLEGDYDDWAVAERERLASLYESVLARIVRTSGDAEVAQRFVARNPYDEEAYVAIIEAELAAGRRSSAVVWVERCRKALSEVDDQPSKSFESEFGKIVRVERRVTDELYLPFVGREAELEVIAARLADAAREIGSIVLVHGEAGVGKSTLLSRVTLLAGESGLRTLAAASASQTTDTFGPWRDLFANAGTGGFDAYMKAHPSDPAEAVGRIIAGTLGARSVVIVDDAHELTGEAFEILIALARSASRSNAIIIGSRPEGVLQLRSRLCGLAVEDVALDRLSRDDLRSALTLALGIDVPEIFNALFDRTDGHPLFFESLLNSLVSSGVLVRNGRGWHFAKPIGADIELPGTLRRFIETRLHARGDTVRAVACALALEPFASSDDIAAVLLLDEGATLDALDDLLALGVITPPSTGPQFAFTHDLFREVAAAGYNAGRRLALHRAFARRLETSHQRDVSLRLARHLKSADEPMAAAHAYLKSARDALEGNAAQDAINRCDEGVREAERLERSSDRDVTIAELQRTAAQTEMARGNIAEAVRRARQAVIMAHAGDDVKGSTVAVLDLAAMEGLAFQFGEQLSDAAKAVESARSIGVESLEAQALVQQANAARDLGTRFEALEYGDAACSLAVKCNRSDIAVAALSALLRTQTTWWLFNDALETARKGIDAARNQGLAAESQILQARSALNYLLGRIDDAQSDIEAALEGAISAGASRSLFEFGCHYMAGKLASVKCQWPQVFEAIARAAMLKNVASLPRHGESLALLSIDALLRRRQPGDDKAAGELVATLASSGGPSQGILGWSDCVELAHARFAVRQRAPVAGAMLRRAVDLLEYNAHRALLDSDVAFTGLAEAAAEIGDTVVLRRAQTRAKDYRSYRVACAGGSWAGRTEQAMG
jgi:DNA-binding SARP family transcriptional activator/tetratricopeptide (TPR) repeat protein